MYSCLSAKCHFKKSFFRVPRALILRLSRGRNMRELRVRHQNYAWGVVGDSTVRRLAVANAKRATSEDVVDGDAKVDEEKPFAELWCGTHPSGMSEIVPGDARDEKYESLASYVSKNPQRTLGEKCRTRFGDGGVPFLMKALSVSTALSIQAHPDKKLAESLHARDPEHYKDDNHKPEMALCVSERFEALSGFASARTTSEALDARGELRDAVGDADAVDALRSSQGGDGGDETTAVKAAFKRVFTALMTAEKSRVECALEALKTRLQDVKDQTTMDPRDRLFLRLNEQYPGDVGAFCAYILNYVILRPGEAIYMAANEPHAYLSGECVEVMATSDNVIRAGLTPKFRDVDVLCDSLTYALGAPEILTGDFIDACTKRYVPPFDEFLLDVVAVEPGCAYGVAPRDGPSIWIVHRGAADFTAFREDGESDEGAVAEHRTVRIEPGAVLFVEAGESCALVCDDAGDQSFVAYVSTTNTL